jgi:hypothetical protein
MHRPTSLGFLLLLAALLTGCDDSDPPTGPSDPTTPTEISEEFAGTLTVNGAVTHPFSVTRAGRVTAQLTSLSVADATVGLSLGTWNGQTCQLIITNDNATVSGTQTFPVTGDASTSGSFCARIYDVGRLTSAVDYVIRVTHF